MAKARSAVLFAIGKGVLVAVAATLLGMVIMAAAVVFLGLPDLWLTVLNQVLKVISICAGVRVAVGIGGERGFVTGMVVALIYMIAGYALYCTFGGMPFSSLAMLAEMVLGAGVGAVCGVIMANLHPKTRARRVKRAHAG